MNPKSEIHHLSQEDIDAAMARLCAWDGLARSDRLRGLLAYLIAESLAGRGAEIKAKTIGMDVYGYTVDELVERESVVRVDAGRLRRKLEEYYGAIGQDDAVRISLPKGRYTPTFEQSSPVTNNKYLEVGKTTHLTFGLWIIGSIIAFIIVTVLGFLYLEDAESGNAAQIATERTAIFDASPNRLRSINLAGVGRDLIFPALGPGQLEAAAVTFEEAIKADETYFGGHAGIAQVQAAVALLSPSRESAAKALESANASAALALQLAPKEAWSQSAVAWVNFANGDFEQARRQSKRALELKPNDPHIVEFDALISLYTGDFERVLIESKRMEMSIDGDPGYVFRNAAGSARYHLGDYTGAIEAFETAIALGAPVGPPTLAYLTAANAKLGRNTRAQKFAEQYVDTWPNARMDLVLKRLFGDPKYAEDVIEAMLKAGWSPSK